MTMSDAYVHLTQENTSKMNYDKIVEQIALIIISQTPTKSCTEQSLIETKLKRLQTNDHSTISNEQTHAHATHTRARKINV